MTLRDFPLLLDENIHPEVLFYLQSQQFDVKHVNECGIRGADDGRVLQHAIAEQRVVVTHDDDFGGFATNFPLAFVGIVYLRPGHLQAQFTIATLRTVLARSIQVTAPFTLVAQRIGRRVLIRVRMLDVE